MVKNTKNYKKIFLFCNNCVKIKKQLKKYIIRKILEIIWKIRYNLNRVKIYINIKKQVCALRKEWFKI